MSEPAWFAVRADGFRIALRLTPRSSRDAVGGVSTLSDGRTVLLARVRAVPDGGRANAALVKLLAAALDVPRSAVTLLDGATSRLKTLRVAGDAADLRERLVALSQG